LASLLNIHAERARIETPCDFKSMHSRVMTWHTHYSGHALTPPPTGRDVSKDTQVELVLAEYSYEQVELRAILALLKIKEHHSSFSSYVLLF